VVYRFFSPSTVAKLQQSLQQNERQILGSLLIASFAITFGGFFVFGLLLNGLLFVYLLRELFRERKLKADLKNSLERVEKDLDNVRHILLQKDRHITQLQSELQAEKLNQKTTERSGSEKNAALTTDALAKVDTVNRVFVLSVLLFSHQSAFTFAPTEQVSF